MKVVGEARLRGSAETVWDALHDVVAVTGAIPGCEEYELTGPGLAQFTVTTAVPAISGTYAAKLTVSQQQRPNVAKLTVAASGDQGAVAADVILRLSDEADGTTLVTYEVDGTVTGSIAGVGTRLLISAAKRLAGEFFDGIDARAVAEPAAGRAAAMAAAPVRPVEEPRAAVRSGGSADRRIAFVPRAFGISVAGMAIGLGGIVVGVLIGRRAARTRR